MSGSKEGSPGLRLKYTQLQRHQTPVPATQHALIQDAVASHIESFDVMIAQSLPLSVRSLHPAHFRTDDKMVSFRMTDVVIHRPVVSSKNTSASDRAMYPAECRESRVSYKGDLSCTIKIDVEGVPTPWEIRRTLGQVCPIDCDTIIGVIVYHFLACHKLFCYVTPVVSHKKSRFQSWSSLRDVTCKA